MAAYKNAKRITRDSEVKIATSAEGIYDNNLVILFWENVEAKYINECIDYLNHADQSTVSGPTTFEDVLFEDDLFHLHAYYSEQDQRIYRLLMRNPIAYFAANWDQTTTKWKLSLGETYASGQSSIVLSMPNVDPAAALSFQEQGLDESYTDSIYILRNIQLTGEWFSVKREAVEDPQTGLFTLRWYLSKYMDNEVGFIYRDSYSSIMTEINVIESNLGVIEDFMQRTRIDESGNWYHDDGSELAYDRKNGRDTAVTTYVADGITVVSLVDLDDGRQIRVRSYYDEREKNWNIQFLIGQQEAYDELLRKDLVDTAGDRVSHWLNPNTKVTIEHGYNITEAAMRTVNGYYTAPSANTTRRIEIQEAGNGRFNFEAIEITTTEYRAIFQFGGETLYMGINSVLKPTTKAGDIEVDSAWAYSGDEVICDTHILLGGCPKSIVVTDGTAGGTYSYDKVEGNRPSYLHVDAGVDDYRIYFDEANSIWTGVAGDSSWLVTNDSKSFLPPKTGWTGDTTPSIAYAVATEGIKTIIDPNANILPRISRDDANSSWNYEIRLIEAQAETYGVEDPTGSTDGEFLFEYGIPENITRWVGRYTMEDIQGGVVSLIGEYRDIPANTYGTHPLLKGKQLVTKTIRNERIENGKISYDVYEQIQTVDIDTDDGWFKVGVTTAYDRKKENILTDLISSDGQSYPLTGNNTGFLLCLNPQDVTASGETPEDTDLNYGNNDGTLDVSEVIAANVDGSPLSTAVPIYARLQLASKRKKTVLRERKYFIRRPRSEDIAATYDDAGFTTTLLSAINAAAIAATDEEADTDVNNLVTYDVIKLANSLWAVERLTVSVDNKFYRDEDSMDHIIDSDGEYMTGLHALVLHSGFSHDGFGTPGAMNPVFVDETKADAN